MSGFDPIRRDIARVALEKLIVDGRIHPARIEEMVERAQREIEQKIREEGEQATSIIKSIPVNVSSVRILRPSLPMMRPFISIGADLAKRYRESKDVINAIEAHHGDVDPRTVEAVLVAAADAVSAARPAQRLL